MSAAEKYPNLKPWVKGQSGNVKGAPRIPEDLKAIKSLSALEVLKIISKYARMTQEELEVAKATKIPMLHMCVISVFEKSLKYGDWQRLSFLLERAIGKPITFIEDEEESSEREKLAKLSMNELLTLVRHNLPEEK